MYMYVAGADPGFQVRGDALKKNCAEQREARNCWGISCEKSRFYAKKKIRPCVVCQKYNTDLDDFRNNEITGIIYQ